MFNGCLISYKRWDNSVLRISYYDLDVSKQEGGPNSGLAIKVIRLGMGNRSLPTTESCLDGRS
jgi:hypothetical protein